MDLALSPLHEACGEISEAERAYFVILFGGEIYKKVYTKFSCYCLMCKRYKLKFNYA